MTLKDSWTKGGKARELPVRTDAQRAVLDRAHRLVGRGSLIPPHRNYRQQLRIYERQTNEAGLSKLHGLRHAYALAELALMFGRAFEQSPQYWLNLQADYDLKTAKASIGPRLRAIQSVTHP